MLHLPHSTPEAQGVDSRALNRFLHAFMALKWTHGVMVLRHGHVIAEHYRRLCSAFDRHQLFSLSKSFTSSAIGIAIGEGRLSLDDRLVSFFPEYDSPAVTEQMRRVTLRNLLTMSSGHSSCALFGERYAKLHTWFPDNRPWVQNILEDTLAYEPGEQFVYNTGATFLLAAVLRKATGQGLVEYLRPRFFRPLGFSEDLLWDLNPDGIEQGGYGFNLRLPEIAAAAQCWLRLGKAPDGTPLIPEDYMRAALSKQIANGTPDGYSDWFEGYGFQFWQCRHGFVRGDGAAGQLAILFPQYDAVLVATAGVTDMQRELDVTWDFLVPAFQGSTEGDDVLQPATFEMGPADPEGAAAFPKPLRFSAGDNPRKIVALTLEPAPDGVDLFLRTAQGGTEHLRAGWTEPRACALQDVDPNHLFAGWGRCHRTGPDALRLIFAIPESTSFYTLDITLGDAPSLHWTTPIAFSRPWLQNVIIPLTPC